MRACLAAEVLDLRLYECCVQALAPRPLAKESGLHGWVSLQRERGAPRITTYFHPRVYRARYGPLAPDLARCWLSPSCLDNALLSMPAKWHWLSPAVMRY